MKSTFILKIILFLVLAFLVCLPGYSQNFNNDFKRAKELKKQGQYVEAAKIFEQWIPLIRDSLGENDTSLYINLVDLTGICYYGAGAYDKAEPLMKEVLRICKKIVGEKHLGYGFSINNLALNYLAMGHYEQAEPLLIEAMQIIKDSLGKNHPTYSTCLNNLALLYQVTGRYELAEPLTKETILIDKISLGKNHPDYGRDLNNLSHLYIKMGKYKEAEPLLKEGIRITKESLGVSHPSYGTYLANLAELYRIMGRYEQAEPLFKLALETFENIHGITFPDYANALNNLALLYYSLGNYNIAEAYCFQALKILKEVKGESHPDYATYLTNLAVLYSEWGHYETAADMLNYACEVYKNVFSETHPDYIRSICNLAILYLKMGNYIASEPLLTKALETTERFLGATHPYYANSLNSLGFIYEKLGNYRKAELCYKEALKVIKNAMGEFHSEYVTCLDNLAGLYSNIEDFSSAATLYLKANEILNTINHYNFTFLSENEKENYLRSIDYHFQFYKSFLFGNFNGSTTFLKNVFNNELLHKGMILASLSALQQSIEESNDTVLVTQYEQLRSLRQQINRSLQLPISERKVDLSASEKQANELEKYLIQNSREFSLVKQQFSITWQDIKKDLQPRQVVIEFFSFNYFNGKKWTGSTLYCALVLRKDYKYPKMVYLFEEKQINALLPLASASEDGILKTYSVNHEESKAKDLYKLIWAPLEPYLEGVTKIDFAVSGQLNRIAFHALSDTSGNLLLNKYDLVQLSSTREVALPKDDKRLESIAIFGGIDYSIDTTDMLAMAREVNTDNLSRSLYRSDTTSRNLSLTYLPGTMEEASEVGKECKEKGIDVNLFSGKLATEEQFRLLGEKKSPSVIHIATHGFYFPEEKQKDRDDRMRFMQIGQQENQFVYSPDPLIRSGLAMAGANHAWKGEKIPEGVEDGILTARDVSQLNLLNTELVVLSACQTGLGDVKGSEGVYGLQRGFKMAGARYLMMSLWKVPDEATKEFMTNFYGHLSSGMAIRDSYRNTQKDMSAKYPEDPFRWAGFVLVE